MGRRLFDIGAATAALIVLSPLMLLVAVAIRASSPGPVIFRARRVGLHSRQFSMFKFRTMTCSADVGSAITGSQDRRVFPLGRLLRRSKIDELPQLFNVLVGEMALVGPRPEDPRLVATLYRPEHLHTLDVRPGLASPGSLYNFTHGEAQLAGPDTESAYAERLLPTKLALDLVYVRRASFRYDVAIMFRTLCVIVAATLGKRSFGDPPEMLEARTLAIVKPSRPQPAEASGDQLASAG